MKGFTRQLRTLLIAVAAAVGAVCWVGCGGGDDNPSGGNTGGNNTGGGTTHTHTWGIWVITTQATCETAGVETRTCATDASHKETREVEKLLDGVCPSFKTVTIGGQEWMAENLNYETPSDSWCYNNSPDSCAKYGRLYTWSAARLACQSVGWRLPTRGEWGDLTAAAGGTDDYGTGGTAATKLKAKSGWGRNGNGTDDYGFSALPGGYRNYYDGNNFTEGGVDGVWWTATPAGSNAYQRYIEYSQYIGEHENVKESYDRISNGFSARCVKGSEHTHTWGSWIVTTPATCNTKGVETKTCTQDTSHKRTREINKLSGEACVIDPNAVVKGTFTDNRNSQTYKTVKIGEQTWMAENLNVKTTKSLCYGEGGEVSSSAGLKTLSSSEIQANCNQYGRLYEWDAALTACPAGWHLPTSDEWSNLANAVGGTSTAGKNLKATSGWNDYNGKSGNGTDDYGFSALPGGYRSSDKRFYSVGDIARWWTATAYGSGIIDRKILRTSNSLDATFGGSDEEYGLSVRCVKDE